MSCMPSAPALDSWSPLDAASDAAATGLARGTPVLVVAIPDGVTPLRQPQSLGRPAAVWPRLSDTRSWALVEAGEILAA